MIQSKLALIGSFVIFCICTSLYFPFPNSVMLNARTPFMSFPIRDQAGYIPLGIIGAILFIIALILLFKGLKKYHFRTILVVLLI